MKPKYKIGDVFEDEYGDTFRVEYISNEKDYDDDWSYFGKGQRYYQIMFEVALDTMRQIT